MKSYREQGVSSPDKADNHVSVGQQQQQPQMVIIQQSPHNQQQQQQMQHVQMQLIGQSGEIA